MKIVLWMGLVALTLWVSTLTGLILAGFIGRADATMVHDDQPTTTTTTAPPPDGVRDALPPSEEIVPPTGGDTGPDDGPPGAQ
jgi:hypothetical protein